MPKKERIGHLKADVAEMDRDNPDYRQEHAGDKTNPKKTRVYVNRNESPITKYLTHGYITETQAMAGDTVRLYHEIAGAKGAGGFDYTKEVVDCSGGKPGFHDAVLDANATLAEYSLLMTGEQYSLIINVCGDRRFIKELAPTKWHRKKAMKQLGIGLTAIAEHEGFEAKGYKERL